MASKKVEFVQPPTKVYRHCEHCNTPFKLYHSEIVRGKGMFCHKSCSAGYKYVVIYDCTCQTCNNRFRSINPSSKYCCINCNPSENVEDIIEILNSSKL